MEYMTALGRCPTCGQDRIQVEGVTKCLLCESRGNPGSGLVVTTEDPGDEALEKLLSKVGVTSITGSKPPEPIKPNLAKASFIPPKLRDAQSLLPTVQMVATENHIMHAINWLKSMPMPTDIKQFKAINKAVKILEGLGE
jgi:hypothetical protein